MSRRRLLLGICAAALLAAPARAHNAVRQPSLGWLVLREAIAVRGTVVGATRSEGGHRVTELRVEKVLKGSVDAETIRFVSDPDHGVRYAAGERALVFLSSATASAAQRRISPYVSPQVFSMKFPVTTFDATGYDALIAGLLEVQSMGRSAERERRLKQVLMAGLASRERKARLYSASALRELGARGAPWNAEDRERILASASAAKDDPEMSAALRAIGAP